MAGLEQTAVKRIIVEADEFPTDQYMAQGLAAQTGATFVRVASGTGGEALEGGGVLLKSVVNYRTALIEDIAALEQIAALHDGDGPQKGEPLRRFWRQALYVFKSPGAISR